MRRLLSLIAAPFRALVRLFRPAPGAAPAPAPVPAPAPREAPTEGTTEGIFLDRARGRSVPYRLYAPQDATGPAPVVIFSHGLGGSRNAAPYLGRALAEAGYWGVFLQHHGSDARLLEGCTGRAELREALQASLADPANMINRFRDISFVIDELGRLADGDGPLGGRIDPDRIGVAGHSYGARTVLAVAGQAVGPAGPAFKDPRVRAGLALSPSGARGHGGDDLIPPEHYAAVDIPLLHVTGTEDRLGEGQEDADFDPYLRTLPFQRIPAADQFLLVLHGARHDDFSGTIRGGDPAPDSRVTIITAEAACLFFDAYLQGRETAWYNLRNKFAEFLDPDDYYEFR